MPISQVEVLAETADVEHADTRSRVFLGLGGREFRLNAGGEALDRGATRRFVLGRDANVAEPGFNDPRVPRLTLGDALSQPAYVRVEPEGANPAWCLEQVEVRVNPGTATETTLDNPRLRETGEAGRLWLDLRYGLALHLTRVRSRLPGVSPHHPQYQEGTTMPDGDLNLTNGNKLIISWHNGGMLSPNDANDARHIAQAWNAKPKDHNGYNTWSFIDVGNGAYLIKNVNANRYLEPKRKDENKGEYEPLEYGHEVWLEKGQPANAKQHWYVRRYGNQYALLLVDQSPGSAVADDKLFAAGLRDPGNNDSWVQLFPYAYRASRMLWRIIDVP
ncbi:RICIN domain-containing protein [Bailinhaonella thermotolerans]|uniref:RICIN domain-containing protein n=1 Tax=Bailinhaonella thermotolerans TaxID=1070861 RepID=UPI00192A66F0|nr:RICIN domain-containing protein [Bailinhaonella thermotolerans]